MTRTVADVEASSTSAPARTSDPAWYRQLWTIHRTLIVVLTPICLLPVPLIYTSSVRLVTPCVLNWCSVDVRGRQLSRHIYIHIGDVGMLFNFDFFMAAKRELFALENEVIVQFGFV